MLLEVKKLEKNFSGIKAVTDCDFNVKENEIVALIGPNGAGKTTVFNILTGLIKADGGSITFKGKTLLNLAPYEIARLGIARTFQLIRLFPKLSVIENMMLAKNQNGERLRNIILHPKIIKEEEKTCLTRCLEFLKILGLDTKKDFLAENLSLGQQRLLEIARALATESDLLLLDEPVSGVNPIMRENIKKILKLLKKDGKTILFIEHDMKFVMDIADRIIVLDHGEEIAIGNPNQIKKNKKVLDAYFGGSRL